MSFKPYKVKLVIAKGATFRRRFKRKAGNPLAPVDMSGYAGRLQVRATADAPDVLLELSTDNGGITLDADGNITYFLPATETAKQEWSAGVYDLQLINGSEVVIYMEGPAVVRKGVTR